MSKREVKAITVRQPWAWSMFPWKGIENRDWSTSYRGLLLIHAAQNMTRDEYHAAAQFIFERSGEWPPEPAALVYGAVIGVADLVDCVTAHESAWFKGAYGFVLANRRPLATPVPCKGALSLWTPPAAVVEAVEAQL